MDGNSEGVPQAIEDRNNHVSVDGHDHSVPCLYLIVDASKARASPRSIAVVRFGSTQCAYFGDDLFHGFAFLKAAYPHEGRDTSLPERA